jgi:hypothetical protein
MSMTSAYFTTKKMAKEVREIFENAGCNPGKIYKHEGKYHFNYFTNDKIKM